MEGEINYTMIRNSQLPEAKMDGYENQHSQKYWMDRYEDMVKAGDKAGAEATSTEVENNLLSLINNPEATYLEKWEAIQNAEIKDKEITTTDANRLRGILKDKPEGMAYEAGVKYIEDLSIAKGGMLGDVASNVAMKGFIDEVQRENYPTSEIPKVAEKWVLKAAREEGIGKDVMKYLEIENEDVRRRDRYDVETYLINNAPEKETQPLWMREVSASKQQRQEAFDQGFKEAYMEEYGEVATEEDILDYKERNFNLNNNSSTGEYKLVDPNQSQHKLSVEAIKNSFRKLGIEIKGDTIRMDESDQGTKYLLEDTDGRFYEYAGPDNIKEWDEAIGLWIYL